MARNLFRIWRSVTVALVLVSCCLSQATADGWEHDFATAIHKAKQLNVPLIVHFHADWCGPCQTMERNVLNTSSVLSHFGSSLVGVKVNSDYNKDLVQRFGITSLPTDVFVSPDNQVLKLSQGSRTLDAYKLLLSQNAVYTQPVGQISKVSAAPSQPATVDGASAANRNSIVLASETTSEKSGSEKNQNSKADRSTILVKNGKRMGLSGYCPVTLAKQTVWQRGTNEFQLESDGVTYQFAGDAELQLFQSDPDKYTPHLHGCDPVSLTTEGSVEPGRLKFGARFGERSYFFVSKEAQAAFLKNPSRYASDINLAFFAIETSEAPSTPKI